MSAVTFSMSLVFCYFDLMSWGIAGFSVHSAMSRVGS
jgi:hypothetical protein